MEEKELKCLKKAFARRWRNIQDKAEKVERLNLPNKKSLWSKVLRCWRKGFRCEYCGRKMMIKDSEYPYQRSFSLDHKISNSLGGDNSIENFAIVCHRCNIIKGTLRVSTFKRLIEEERALVEDPDFLDRVFSEMWNGRLANKLERVEARSGWK